VSEFIATVFAKDTATVQQPGGGMSVLVAKGSHWPATDPLVAAHPELFSPDPRWGMQYTAEPAGYGEPMYEGSPVVEQATAAPGERRATRPRA
jgi:hypothetical protein